jgi:HD superfamily phosphodiesterase
MATSKTVNYTPEQVATMREAYEKAKDEKSRDSVVMKMAEKFGKSKRSIVSKMSREGFYIAKTPVSKVTGEKPAKKEDLAVQLREVSGLPMVSAEKLNKTDLQDLISHFKEVAEVAKEIEAATPENQAS